MRYFLVLIFFLAGLYSCNKARLLDETVSFANNKWAYDKIATFDAEVNDTTQFYNLYLDIAHGIDYNYQNLYIKIKTTFPGGEQLEEKVNIDFADKTGRWYSDCSGKDCTLRVDIQKQAFFNQLGKHTFMFEQYVRENPLEHIQSLNFVIEAI